MVYRNNSMSAGTFEYYIFEKNLQGDIVAVYDTSGIKLISYTYDAWGNVTTNYSNGGNSTAVRYNRFRYRGYFYDEEMGLYYLNSRYYDPAIGRFLNADVFINANGDLTGFNMYAYCSNNPVMFVDESGKGLSEFWKGVGEFFHNIGDAIVSSVEAEFGLGWGVGAEVDDVGAEYYMDFYVGVDDGTTVAGNIVSSEAKLSIFGIGDTYVHCSEKGDKRYFCKECGLDMSAKTISKCSHSEKARSFSLSFFSINNKGDIVIGTSASAHAILGGHYSLGFNVTEFFERLFDDEK